MTFTNADCVGKDWTWYKVFVDTTLQAEGQVGLQVLLQVDSQVSEQKFYPIRNTISKELNK
jgi:hypothetical protein